MPAKRVVMFYNFKLLCENTFIAGKAIQCTISRANCSRAASSDTQILDEPLFLPPAAGGNDSPRTPSTGNNLKILRYSAAAVPVLVLALSGCAVFAPSRQADALNKLVGNSASELVQAWGTPSDSRRLEDGSWVYRWRNSRVYWDLRGREWLLWCETRVVAKEDRIKRADQWGNDCARVFSAW